MYGSNPRDVTDQGRSLWEGGGMKAVVDLRGGRVGEQIPSK